LLLPTGVARESVVNEFFIHDFLARFVCGVKRSSPHEQLPSSPGDVASRVHFARLDPRTVLRDDSGE